jgi:hypothetical protein
MKQEETQGQRVTTSIPILMLPPKHGEESRVPLLLPNHGSV